MAKNWENNNRKTNRPPRENGNQNSNGNSNGNGNRKGNGKGNGKGRGNSQKSESGSKKPELKNPCKLPGHKNHEWKDCFNNPNSEKFKGTAKSFRYYNTDGSRRKKSKNEEANPVEEKLPLPGLMERIQRRATP